MESVPHAGDESTLLPASFRLLADSAPVMIWMSGADKQCTFFNRGWLDFTGRTMEEERGEGWVEGVHPDDLERCLEVYVSHFDRRDEFEMEYRLRHHSGTYRWILDRGAPRFGPDGTFLGYIGSGIDITKQKSHEAQLLDAVGRAVIATDLDGVITFWNRSAESLYGWAADDVLGHSIVDINPANRMQEQVAAVLERVSQGETVTIELDVDRQDGTTVSVLATVSPIRNSAGEVVGTVGVSADITERKRVEEERQELLSALQTERSQLKDIIMKAPAFMVTLRGPDHVFEYVNERYQELIGHRDAVDKTVLEVLPEVADQGFLPLIDRVYETGEPFEGREMPIRLQPGPDAPAEEYYIDLSYVPLYEPGGTVSGVLAHGVDVTEQVQSRRRLKLLRRLDQAVMSAQSTEAIAEAVLELLCENRPYLYAAVVEFDFEEETYVTLSARPADSAMFSAGLTQPITEHGYMSKLVLGETVQVSDAAVEPKGDVHGQHAQTHLIVPLMVHDECLGALHFASHEALSDANLLIAREAASSLAVALQSTRLRHEVSAAHRRLEALSRRIVGIQERERRSLALELHDEMGQTLTSIALSLDQAAGGTLSEEAEVPMRRARRLVQKLTSQVRDLSFSLRPSLLDDLGLLPALEWYFRRYQQQTGVEVLFSHASLEDHPLPTLVESTAYRIVQEALTNVARHAGVDQARVKVLLRHQTLYLRVEDDGAGFDPMQRPHGEGGGLSGMKERARLLEGEMSIETAPGAGVIVTAVLPVSEANATL